MNKEKRQNIMGLIASAETYGFKDDVLFDGFGILLDRKLTEKEIDEYIKENYDSEEGRSQGYTKEDFKNIKNELMEFKRNFTGEMYE